MKFGRLGEQGRVIEVGLRDAGEVGVSIRKGEHVDHRGIHGHGLEVGGLFWSGGLDGQHFGTSGGGRKGGIQTGLGKVFLYRDSMTLNTSSAW